MTTTTTLANAISNMDYLSQEGFSSIASIARLALVSLQQPDATKHMQDIGNALQAIAIKADDIQNCINAEAEATGNQYRATPAFAHHH